MVLDNNKRSKNTVLIHSQGGEERELFKGFHTLKEGEERELFIGFHIIPHLKGGGGYKELFKGFHIISHHFVDQTIMWID